MLVSEALKARKSVRAFLDKPVANDKIMAIMEAVRHTPSGTNTQPWQIAVVSGESKRQLDAKLLQAFTSGVEKNMDYKYYPPKLPREMQVRRIDCGMRMYETLQITRQDTEKRLEQWGKNYSAFGAPVVLYFFLPRQVEAGSILDCGMMMQSVMLAATEQGLATCPQAALAEYPDIVREFLGAYDDSILICGMALGYADNTAPINNYLTPREEVNQFAKFFE